MWDQDVLTKLDNKMTESGPAPQLEGGQTLMSNSDTSLSRFYPTLNQEETVTRPKSILQNFKMSCVCLIQSLFT